MKRRRHTTVLAALMGAASLFAVPLCAQSLETCREHRRFGRLQEATACYQRLAASQDPYLRAEGNWGLGRWQDANDAFREAVQAQPKNPDYRVRWGRLFLERMQPADAQALFLEALAIRDPHPGAILGLALIASDGFEARGGELARKALEADPKLTEAHVLLATLALQESSFDKALEHSSKALEIDPNSLEALSIPATIDLLEDKVNPPSLARIFKINPVYGEVYATAGRFFVLNRRYEEAIALYRKALDLNPGLHKARAELGLNLMRMGYAEEARKHLEMCWEAGERYAAVGNPLRLLDSIKNFRMIRSGNLILKLHEREAEFLRPFVEEEARRAIATFEKKYRMKLERPVQVELYPDHEDFAVRTLGMPGMAGALGVTFGYTVAMDSPSSRKPGELHWASTLWHELSHVFTISATNSRVPRWFTEAMAVYEETAVRPDWGDRLTAPIIFAIRDRKLLPVTQLERGFVHPESAEQVLVSYYQAGKICNFIEQKWGFDKLLEMLKGFGEKKSTDETIRAALGVSPEEFDQRFLAWVEDQTRVTVQGFDKWKKGMARIAELVKAGRHEDVIREAPPIRDIYSEYVEGGNLYEVLADSYLALNNEKAAAAELQRYADNGGRSPQALKKLARLLESQGRPKEAIEALRRLNWIYPRDEELQRWLGDLYMAQGDAQAAIRAYQAVVAMRPLDRASAHYNLARAYKAAGQRGPASDQVLLALEAAPGFRPAQKLLLELEAAEAGPAASKEGN